MNVSGASHLAATGTNVPDISGLFRPVRTDRQQLRIAWRWTQSGANQSPVRLPCLQGIKWGISRNSSGRTGNFSSAPPAAKLVENGEVYGRHVRGSSIGSRSSMVRSDQNWKFPINVPRLSYCSDGFSDKGHTAFFEHHVHVKASGTMTISHGMSEQGKSARVRGELVRAFARCQHGRVNSCRVTHG